MPLKIKSTSGSVTLEAENVSGDTTLIVPSGTGELIAANSSGNVGIGVVPESHYTGYVTLDIGDSGGIYSNNTGTNATIVTDNSYLNSDASNWLYKNTDEASHYNQSSGKHIFKVAPSGTADSAISWTTAMTIDNSGAVTKPAQPAFSVKLSGNQLNLAVYGRRLIEFDSEVYDVGSNFNTSTHHFTAPVTGKYQLNFSLEFQGTDGQANWYGGHIETSNRVYQYYNLSKKNGDDSDGLAMSALADMDAGDTAFVSVYQHGGTTQTDVYPSSSFNGFLAC